MKDEIKEILDNFKIYEDRYKKCNETQFIIFYRDIHLLLDYITNLQEENERLEKEQLITNMAYETVLNFYKQRNEKAIEYIERCRNYHRNIHKEERIFSDEITSLLMILNGGDE